MGAGGLNWNTIYYSVHSHTVIALQAYSYLGKSNICLSTFMYSPTFLSLLFMSSYFMDLSPE